MLQRNEKEEKMCQAFLQLLRLSRANRLLAEAYLDMDREENPDLLKEVKPENFSMISYIPGEAKYLEWLKKKNRTEELERVVSFLVEAGGSTAWCAMIGEYSTKLDLLEKFLPYHRGEHSEAQKMAVRAGLCVRGLYHDRTEDTRRLCMQGRERPEIFLQAMEFCRDCDGYTATGKRSHARLLLVAMYLHHKLPGEASEEAKKLLKNMVDAMADLAAFDIHELQTLQYFVRTAGKDTPFPRRILSIFHSRSINPAWCAACSFLAIRHSVQFEILLRLMVAVDYKFIGRNLALDVCAGIAEETWSQERMDEIEEMLPILDEEYVRWALLAGCRAVVKRMAAKSREGIRGAVPKLSSEQYRNLLGIVKDADAALYEELMGAYRETLLEKIASELLFRRYAGADNAAKRYLLGECAADSLDSCMDDWEAGSPDEEKFQKIEFLRENGEYPMYRRAVVLEALRKETGYLDAYRIEAARATPAGMEEGQEASVREGREYSYSYSEKQINGLLCILEEEKVPLWMQTKALAGICEGIKDRQKKAALSELYVELFADRRRKEGKSQWQMGMKKAVSEGKPPARCFALKVLEKLDAKQYKESILACAEDSSKQVRSMFLESCRVHREWEAEILALLCAKKPKAREAAVLALEEWGNPAFLEAVRRALSQEKNKKVMELLQGLVKELEETAAEPTEANLENEPTAKPERSGSAKTEAETLAAEIFRGGRKRKVEWVQNLELPTVHRMDGSAVSPEYMFAILTCYADMEIPGRNWDAAKLAAPLAEEELSLYMQAVYEAWMEAGAEAKKRWVLYAVSIHGGVGMAAVFYSQIKDWAEHSRGAIASDAVRALALNGSSDALLLVDQMSRKFKFRQIKNAAEKALSEAAAQLGISREELEDRLVPNPGFDEQMELRLDYGSRSFTVRLTPALELEIYDGSSRKLKNLPAPGKQDDTEKAARSSDAFKQLKKQLKVIAATQKLRLEQALRTGRSWRIEKWQELFVKNPVMHQFATGLVWGVYENDMLKQSFRYMEDGSFNTVDEEEYSFAGASLETDRIGLVHPLELSAQELAAWKEQLAEYEVSQPFAQLVRPVYRIAGESTAEDGLALTRFDGKELPGISLSGKLLGTGWFRGEILDAGWFRSYYRSDGRFGAELTFSGSSVGYEMDEVTVYHLYFYSFQKQEPENDGYQRFRTECRCRPEEVNPRYFSEVVLQVVGIVG